MHKVLVTGACGFIGEQLSRKLLAIGCHVRGVDVCGRALPGVELFNADIASPGLEPRIVEGIDTVFHLAGKAHALSETRQDADEYFRVNTEGTRQVLELAKKCGVRRVVFFSTVKAMSRDSAEAGGRKTEDGGGRTEERPLTEEYEVEPDTAYGKSKLAAERLVLHGGYVAEAVVLRLCMVYGPNAKGNMEKMIEAVRHNRFPPLPEVGNKRSMVHVQDVVQAAILAGTHPNAGGQVFIVSDGQTYSTRQMYELICRALNKKPPGWTVPVGVLRGLAVIGDLIGKARGRRFPFDSDAFNKLIGSAWFSSEKMQQALGFRPEWTLERALPEMVAGLE